MGGVTLGGVKLGRASFVDDDSLAGHRVGQNESPDVVAIGLFVGGKKFI